MKYNQLFGYAGSILRVDLTRGKVVKKRLEKYLTKFLGGRCLAAKLLFDELSPHIDPLGPDNKLIFVTGPLTGAGVPSGNRYIIATKSPQTGLFLDSHAGGHFGPEIKYAGFDFIIIEGAAKEPSYLSIDNDKVEIKRCPSIWGLDCWEAEKALKEELGDETARAAVIGPAGEHLVNFSLVSNDYFHQCGRGGAGAVMGSKKLKGIVVRGDKGIKLADPDGLLEYLEGELDWKLREGPSADLVKNIKYDTPGTVEICQELGLLPTYNFRQGQFEKACEIGGHAMRERIVAADKACYSCITPCNKFSVISEGVYKNSKIGGPEYETIALLGSNLGVGSIEAIAYANVLCDKLGLDTISTGNVIGFAIECFEKGLITTQDTNGLELRFGDPEVVLKLISKIAVREGIGELLAMGVKRAAEKIGRGSERFAMHVKAMEYPGYQPGASPAFALEYAVTDRGGCHRRAWPVFAEKEAGKPYTTEGRAKLIKRLFDERLPLHSGIVCDLFFGWCGLNSQDFIKMVRFVTGRELTGEDLQILAERGFAIARAFNVREGVDRKDDMLAPRTMEEPQPIGPAKGKKVSKEMLEEMLDEYYSLRGWDKRGIPKRSTLEALGLNEIAKELEKHVKLS